MLGIVQGLTEFLPVSSTAHVYIVSQLFGWDDPGAAFTAVTQIGTETAVLVYFRGEIWHILKVLVGWFTQPRYRGTPDSRLAWGVVWGSLPIGVFGLLLRDYIEGDARNLTLIAVMLVLFGAVLIVVEWLPGRTRTSELDLRSGLAMGFAQALALIPGVSRSGSTISMGLFVGLERRAATRYAFLLAIPAVLASGGDGDRLRERPVGAHAARDGNGVRDRPRGDRRVAEIPRPAQVHRLRCLPHPARQRAVVSVRLGLVELAPTAFDRVSRCELGRTPTFQRFQVEVRRCGSGTPLARPS